MKSESISYKEAGVDITAGYEGVKLIKKHIAKTLTPGVLSEVGGFGGLFQLNMENTKEPVLVSGTDGVGTKLKLAFIMNKHDTIGIDCVAMCVNDIICSGAAPLFFLDYLALGKNIPSKVEQIVSGIAEGCLQSSCALIGGETAEMPGFYPDGEYDLAGFSVGIVNKEDIIDGKNINAGDIAIALPSSGVHSNGFSLLRKEKKKKKMENLMKYEAELEHSLGEELLTPTKIYVKPILTLMKEVKIKGIAHITGGGFYENLPRMLPKGLSMKVKKEDIQIPAIFKLTQKVGNISEKDMFNTFNMGVGMCIVVGKEDINKAIKTLTDTGEKPYIIGTVVKEEGGVIFD